LPYFFKPWVVGFSWRRAWKFFPLRTMAMERGRWPVVAIQIPPQLRRSYEQLRESKYKWLSSPHTYVSPKHEVSTLNFYNSDGLLLYLTNKCKKYVLIHINRFSSLIG
jgi:hypothetical protein